MTVQSIHMHTNTHLIGPCNWKYSVMFVSGVAACGVLSELSLSSSPLSLGKHRALPSRSASPLFWLQQKQGGWLLAGSCTVLGDSLTDPRLGHMLIPEPVTMPRGWNSLLARTLLSLPRLRWGGGAWGTLRGWCCEQRVRGSYQSRTNRPRTSPWVFPLWLGCCTDGHPLSHQHLFTYAFFLVPGLHSFHRCSLARFGPFHAF